MSRVRFGSATLAEEVRRVCSAQRVDLSERVQELWGGYGQLWRGKLERADGAERYIVVKHVKPPKLSSSDAAATRSHRRKLRSYEVESAFYTRHASRCGQPCRVPALVGLRATGVETLLVLEDLDFEGFPARRQRLSCHDVELCLAWLAQFHATFLGANPEGLWKVGTYWHLATRPDELANIADAELRRRAPAIDEKLRRAEYQTLVHGDAKLENFCFASDASAVAALDFQYVGGGVGVKDVAYLLSSCFDGDELAALAPGFLDFYFAALRAALSSALARASFAALEAEWRALYPYAWADLQRFLAGWAPAYARDAYALALTRDVLAELSRGPKKQHSGG